jgi:YtkA-like
MKKAAAVILAVVMAASVAYAKGYEVQKKAGDYDVLVSIDKNPPITGDNGVSIAVKDATGKMVTDAKVKVEYSMPAMMGMPPMHYKTEAVLQGDEYKASLGLSMSGSWNIAVKIMRAGKTSTLKFTVDAK